MTVYTSGNVPCDELQVGDQVAFSWMTTWGPITAIHPYRCSEKCIGCGGDQCSHVAGWRFARFATGQEITMTPGDQWFPGPRSSPRDLGGTFDSESTVAAEPSTLS